VIHFNVFPQITFLFLILEKDVSNKSCMALKETQNGVISLTLNSCLKITF